MSLATYLPASRQWQVITADGSKKLFDKPWLADTFALKMNAPQLYKLATDTAKAHRVLKSRAWKAAVLVANGKVNFMPRNDPTIIAEVQGSKGVVYEVRDVGGVLACTCPDFLGGAPVVVIGRKPVKFCKHCLAVQFAKAIGLSAGVQIDEFGTTATAVPVIGHMDVRKYGDGSEVSFSLQKSHAYFMQRHQRVANSREELVNWNYRD